jgi:PIN domain nuclease of toxin-antitoxin system
MGCRALIVLDTHVLLWLDAGSKELAPRVRKLIDEAARAEELAVSALSFWEVATLCRKDRVRLRQRVEDWRVNLLSEGLREFPLTGPIAIAGGSFLDLPGDSADRMIAATAMHHGATLVTADRQLLSWQNPLPRMDARARAAKPTR